MQKLWYQKTVLSKPSKRQFHFVNIRFVSRDAVREKAAGLRDVFNKLKKHAALAQPFKQKREVKKIAFRCKPGPVWRKGNIEGFDQLYLVAIFF